MPSETSAKGPDNDPVVAAQRQWVARGWSATADAMGGATSLIRAQRVLLTLLDQELGVLGLSFARYELLALLLFSRTGALSLTTICQQLEVQQPTASVIVKRLQHQGLITRVPHTSDRRSRLVRLTPEGRERVLAATHRLNETVFSGPLLTRTQANDLGRLRRRLIALRERDRGDTD